MKEKIKTLDKNNEKLKLKKIVKKQKLQEKGITLIALVVTIIILLILAGVTLNIALSDNGLFSKSKKVATDYNQKSIEEKLQLLYAEKIMEDNDSNTKVKTDVTDVLEEMTGGEITEEKIEEFNKLLEQYNKEVKGIKTAEDFALIGTDNNYPIDGVYVQLSDIEELTTQIGSYEQPFKGIYNGNGKSIKKLEIKANEDFTGMFRANEGTVKNITIEDCQITSEKRIVGGLVGRNVGIIENIIINKGNIISAGNNVGGICGSNSNNGIIYECKNSASISGSDLGFGGICGVFSSGLIQSCVNEGSISGGKFVGGVAGQCDGRLNGGTCEIIDCKNTGLVKSSGIDSNSTCGGIAGYFRDSNMEGCLNEGSVIGDGLDVGGLVGSSMGRSVTRESKNYGSISGSRYVRRVDWNDRRPISFIRLY